MNAGGAGRRPFQDAPTGFIRKSWRPFVIGPDGAPDGRAWEVCVLFELRDRLRAGDLWVEGSRRFLSLNETLVPPASFAALRTEGPLPVGVSQDGAAYDFLPRIKITDLLLEVDDWTGFTASFTHQRSGALHTSC